MANAQDARANDSVQDKPCRKCGETKPRTEFYRHPKMPDGTLNACKDCVKARVRQRARTNPAVQEYDRARAKTPKRKAQAARIGRAWREKNPAGYQAQTEVGNAIREGRIAKEPCLFCGRDDVHAHHKDYAKPLDVIWLCPRCHHRLHAYFPETEGANKKAAF